jgi:hypothetical protein
LRSFLIAALLVGGATCAAMADESVAGAWRADMGNGVVISMNVAPTGEWSSETSQHQSVLRQLKGTYTQKKTNDHTGTLVFTPVDAPDQKGHAKVETDHYQLSSTSNQLKLTSGGDTMVFNKQAGR